MKPAPFLLILPASHHLSICSLIVWGRRHVQMFESQSCVMCQSPRCWAASYRCTLTGITWFRLWPGLSVGLTLCWPLFPHLATCLYVIYGFSFLILLSHLKKKKICENAKNEVKCYQKQIRNPGKKLLRKQRLHKVSLNTGTDSELDLFLSTTVDYKSRCSLLIGLVIDNSLCAFCLPWKQGDTTENSFSETETDMCSHKLTEVMRPLCQTLHTILLGRKW